MLMAIITTMIALAVMVAATANVTAVESAIGASIASDLTVNNK